jgi:hypothetical protein
MLMLERPPVVFLGPTLPQPEAAALLPACFRPPARRGDIYRALAEGFTTIVLIDGEFHGAPSVWQREIVDAVNEGAVVHGASSMGAIRAAELHSFGMIGHGRIFEWYRDGVIDADDEVALAYGPPEFGYRAMSEPLVNIRATLEAATHEIIAPRQRDQVIEFIKGFYFPERSFALLIERGPVADWPAERRDRLAQFIEQTRIDQKRDDAVLALTAVAANASKRHAPQGEIHADRRDSGQTQVIGTTARDNGTLGRWQRERLVAEGLIAERAMAVADIVRCAGISEPEAHAIRLELSALFFVALWGRARGIVPTDADFARLRASFPAASDIPIPRLNGLLATRALAEASIRAFSAANGAESPEAGARAIICDWAHNNGIEHAGLEGQALVDWLIEAGPSRFGYMWSFEDEIIDHLLLLGRAAGLRPREVA